MDGEETYVSFKLLRPGNESRTLAWKAAMLTTTLGLPPNNDVKETEGMFCLRSPGGNIVMSGRL